MTSEWLCLGRISEATQASSRGGDLPPIDGLIDADGRVPYEAGLEVQYELHRQVVAGERGPSLIMLEHPSVYTAGRQAKEEDRPYDGTPVVAIDRGGQLTWHGPGQLVVYLSGALRPKPDVRQFVSDLETAIIDALAEFGIQAVTVEGRPGVWLPGDERGPDRKIAALGLAIRQGATLHGIAVNCTNDPRPFAQIVPCGLKDASVTSMALEGIAGVEPVDLAPVLGRKLDEVVSTWFVAAPNKEKAA